MRRKAIQREFTDSSESEDSAVNAFAEQPKKGFNIQSSVSLIGDEEPSPSQYRVERVREDADDHPQSQPISSGKSVRGCR